MSNYWNENIRNIQPYVPGEQPQNRQYIKLNTNENPYPPSPKVIEAIKHATGESLRLYPDPMCTELCSTIAEYYQLDKGQVFVGNGSDEVLAFCFQAFFSTQKHILFPDITYSFYKVYANLYQIPYKLIYLDDNFTIPVEDFTQDNGGILIANPNAPTAKYLSLDKIETILEKNLQSVVIIDEAYIDFGGKSAVSLIKKYPNLLVIQTFSKSRSLAGLRIGFALGHEDLVQGLERVKNSFNSYTLDRLALAGAIEAVKDVDYVKKTAELIISTREKSIKALREIGFKVIDSQANFIFISHPLISAQDLLAQLREKGILVRYFNQPRIDNYLRVTIGTEEGMETFLCCIKEMIPKK